MEPLIQLRRWPLNMNYLMLMFFLACTFLMGGSARYDVQSLLVLQPMAALFAGLGIWMLTKQQWRTSRTIIGFIAASCLVLALQIMPLPLSLIQALPDRNLQRTVEQLSGLPGSWRSISMAPYATWQMLLGASLPIAVLLICASLSDEQKILLLPAMLALGFLSAFWALMQIVTGRDGGFYLYRITNEGAAVGLLANRNHQGTLLSCLFPMLATFTSLRASSPKEYTRRAYVAAGLGVMLIPLLLMTGSRLGLFTGAIGIAAAVAIHRQPQISKKSQAQAKPRRSWISTLFAIAVSTSLAWITIYLARAESLRRLMIGDNFDDARLQVWQSLSSTIAKNWLIGTGAGSFSAVYQSIEPDRLLKPNYVNQVHNDWLDLILTAGVFGYVFLGWAIIWISVLAVRAWSGSSQRSETQLARLGSVLILLLAIGSLADYPLRTPILLATLVIAVFWLTMAPASNKTSSQTMNIA